MSNQSHHYYTPKSNHTATAGLVFSVLGLVLGWIPIIGWLLWLLGLILSIVGLFSQPRGRAIAGLVISFIGVILLILLFGGLALLTAVAAAAGA